MVVSLRGTSGDSIDDLCVVFFYNVYNLRVTSEEVWCPDLSKEWSQGSGRRKWTAHAGQGLAKVRVLKH
jgi:hypothetical protein